MEVLSTPLAEVNADVALVRRQILIAGLIALVAASLIGFWASGAVSRRLRRMREAAEAVAEGHFDQPIPIDSSDELGQLARSFNDMQRRLARLDSSRKEFIANASHELRTPIFSLGGFVELLETEKLTAAERRTFVAEMRAQIQRLQKLTIDLLDLSRLDADVVEIQREQVDLKEVARQVADEFRPAAKAHRSSLQVRGRGEVVALADLNRVSQIIRILIDNAITHTPQGTNVTVTAVRGSARRGADRRRRRQEGHRPPSHRQGLRSLLHGRHGDRLGPGPRHRRRAGAAHGRPAGRRLPPRPHRVHAQPALASAAGASGSPPGRPREEAIEATSWPRSRRR